jgi:hypothetical protein
LYSFPGGQEEIRGEGRQMISGKIQNLQKFVDIKWLIVSYDL